jgi:hypothetical protein
MGVFPGFCSMAMHTSIYSKEGSEYICFTMICIYVYWLKCLRFVYVAEKIVVLFFRSMEKGVSVCCYRSSAPFALLPPHSSACVHPLLDTRWQDQQILMSSSKRVTPDQVALSLLTSSTFTVKPLEHGFKTLCDQYTSIKL